MVSWLSTCSNGRPSFCSASRGDADAGILDADHHRAARHAAAHRDAAVLRRELHGVGQQIERDLLERAPVGLEADAGRDPGGDLELLLLRARGDHAHRVGELAVELDVFQVELEPAGLDLRHVEDVVDDVEQILRRCAWMSRQYSSYLSEPSAPNMPGLHDLGEADDGVERRAQLVAHVGEEFRLGLVGFLGAVFSSAYFSASWLRPAISSFCCDWRRSVTVAISRCSLSDQLLLVLLERGDVGADRDVAAVLGAPLADLQPVAVVELRLEGARAGHGRVFAGELGADDVLAAGRDHRLVGRAGGDRLVGQAVQVLEVRIAQHQAVVVVPQHEGFRDGLDGVAQAHVGGGGPLDQRLLLGDVDRDADQMHAGLAGLLHQLAARAQPDPFAAGVVHAELVVDGAGLGVGELGRDLVELDVVGMHQLADLAEGHQVVAGLQAEDREHRVRPEDAAAREVPVPQPAAAAIERGVDAAAHRVVDRVGLARARGLPVEGEAEDQQHEAGGGGQRDGQRGVGAPGAPARRCAAGTRATGRAAASSVRTVAKARLPSASVISSTPALAPRMVSGCVVAEHVDEARADRPAGGRGRGDDAVGVARAGCGGRTRWRAATARARAGRAAWCRRSPRRPAGRSARRRSRRRCRCRGWLRRSPGGDGRAPAPRRRRRW